MNLSIEEFGCAAKSHYNFAHPLSPIPQPSPIRMFLGSSESSRQGLSNGPGPIQMRPAIKNAHTPVHSPSSNLLVSILSQPIIIFVLAKRNSYLLINSYPKIYVSSQTSNNSMSNCLFYDLSCFAYNTPTTTAINMFLPPFKSSYRPFFNNMCPVQMRPAVQNATRIQC